MNQFVPIPAQQRFLDLQERIVGYIAGRREGKTAVGANKALQRICTGNSGLIVGTSPYMLRRATLPEIEEWAPAYDLQPMILMSQAQVKFASPCAATIRLITRPTFLPAPVNWIWFDDIVDLPSREIFDALVPQARIGENPQVWITSYPPYLRDDNHWLWDLLEEIAYVMPEGDE